MKISWWMRRIRKLIPIFIVLIVLYFASKLWSKRRIEGQRSATLPSVPPLIKVAEPPFTKWSKWVVMFTNEEDGCSPLSLKFPGWTLLVIVPQKTRSPGYEHCILMGEDELYQWRNRQNLAQVDSLHVNVLAHLYAIKNQAEFIYIPGLHSRAEDIDDSSIFATENFTGLVYTGGEPFDPGVHFGCRIKRTQSDSHTAKYSLCTYRTPGIQVQVDVAVEPLKQDFQFSVPSCDSRAPPVTLHVGNLVEFGSQGILYSKNALWAIPYLYEENNLPYYNTLVWNLVAQKVLWLAGDRLMVHSIRSTMDKPITFPNIETVKLSIEEWECRNKKHLYVCVMELVKTLVEKHLIDGSIGPLLHDWLNALNQIGYEMPTIGSGTYSQCTSNDIIFDPVDYKQIIYRKNLRSPKVHIPVNNVQELYLSYHEVCSRFKENEFHVKLNFTHPWFQLGDILLVVTYNNPHYESISYVETLYRPFFPYIIHCGPGIPNFKDEKLRNLRNFAFSFYSYGGTKTGHAKGSFNYECITSAINMHYRVEGYLTIADDMLISVYKTFDLRRYLTWYLPTSEIRMADVKKLKECRLGMCDFFVRWHWWEDYQGQILSLLQRMEKEQYTSALVNRCYTQLITLNGGPYRVNGGYSDVYYIPDRLSAEFASLASLFLEEDIFLEIAVPTILRCLESSDEIELLRGIASWELERESAWIYFNKKNFLGKSYLHPTKWSYIANDNVKYQEFYCQKVLPYLHDQNGRLTD